MRKIVALLLVVVFVLAFSSVAFAISDNMANGLVNSPAFDNMAGLIFTHNEGNSTLRISLLFNTIGITEKPGTVASDNSVLRSGAGYTWVDAGQ